MVKIKCKRVVALLIAACLGTGCVVRVTPAYAAGADVCLSPPPECRAGFAPRCTPHAWPGAEWQCWWAGGGEAAPQASADPCPGLTPICHLGTAPACLCSGTSRYSCAWQCVGRP